MKKFLVLLVIPILVFSSGCTIPFLNIEIPGLPDIIPGTQVQEKRHDVISIESMQVIPSAEIRSGQTVRLRAVVKNLQSPEYDPTKDVEITLYNDCGIFKAVKTDFCQGTPTNNDKDGLYTCTIDRMHPQSTQVVEWSLQAEEVKVDTQCKFGVLARYRYYTPSTGSVAFINRKEVERLVSEGKTFTEIGTTVIGEGPIKSYIEVLNQPIIIDNTKPTEDAGTGMMSFWISNRGMGLLDASQSTVDGGNLIFDKQCSGKELKKTVGEKTIEQVCMKIESEELVWIPPKNDEGKPVASGTSILDCLKYKLEKKKTVSGKSTDDGHSANFIGKSTPKYSCSIGLKDPSRIKQEKTYQIKSEIHYFYKFVKEIQVTVKPQVRA